MQTERFCKGLTLCGCCRAEGRASACGACKLNPEPLGAQRAKFLTQAQERCPPIRNHGTETCWRRMLTVSPCCHWSFSVFVRKRSQSLQQGCKRIVVLRQHLSQAQH